MDCRVPLYKLAINVLQESKRSLHYKEIISILHKQGIDVEPDRLQSSLSAYYCTHYRKGKREINVHRVAAGTYYYNDNLQEVEDAKLFFHFLEKAFSK